MNVTRRTWITNPEGNGGAWQYHDEKEALFVFEMLMTTGIDISSIDSFIEGKEHPLPEPLAQHLAERRSEALRAYQEGDIRLAQSLVDALRNACLYYGQNLAAAPDVQGNREKVKGSRKAAKAPRRRIVDDDWAKEEYEKLIGAGVPVQQARSKLRGLIHGKYKASDATVNRAVDRASGHVRRGKKIVTSAASDKK